MQWLHAAIFLLLAVETRVDAGLLFLSARRAALGSRRSFHGYALAKDDTIFVNSSLSSSEWRPTFWSRVADLFSSNGKGSVTIAPTALNEALAKSAGPPRFVFDPVESLPGITDLAGGAVSGKDDLVNGSRDSYPSVPIQQSVLQAQDTKPTNISFNSFSRRNRPDDAASSAGKSIRVLANLVSRVLWGSENGTAPSTGSSLHSDANLNAGEDGIHTHRSAAASIASLSSIKQALRSSSKHVRGLLASMIPSRSAELSSASRSHPVEPMDSSRIGCEGNRDMERRVDNDGNWSSGLDQGGQNPVHQLSPALQEVARSDNGLVDVQKHVQDSPVGGDMNLDLDDQRAMLSLAVSVSALPSPSSSPASPSNSPTSLSESIRQETSQLSRQASQSSVSPRISVGASLSERVSADFLNLLVDHVKLAVSAASAVRSRADAQEYLRSFPLHLILSPILPSTATGPSAPTSSNPVDALNAACNLLHFAPSLADDLAQHEALIQVLVQNVERPPRRFAFVLPFQDEEVEQRQEKCQWVSLVLLFRIIRLSSDVSLAHLRRNGKLIKVLQGILNTSPSSSLDRLKYLASFFERNATDRGKGTRKQLGDEKRHSPSNLHNLYDLQRLKQQLARWNQASTSPEFDKPSPLGLISMARVAAWGLGDVPWKARQAGQRGLRILSLDGGGTRGVLTIAFLKEIFQRVNALRSSRSSSSAAAAQEVHPFECFDMICGTSTGGIIAMLLGGQCLSIGQSEVLYDEFIDKIFATRSNLKLVTEQAAYDEREFERILLEMTGDRWMLDTNVLDCPRVFCVSTKVNANPPQAMLWRNYDYPAEGRSRYAGSCRVSTRTAIRATTAAPTFFTPVPWAGGLYVDGALVANNPTAIAVQEAKAIYPDVPIELVLSIGTGYFVNSKDNLKSLGWDLLVNQLIASTTDTEDVHGLLGDFLARDKYYRVNPVLKENFAIDEKDRNLLASLKTLAASQMADWEKREASRVEALVRTLAGTR